jgi:hypothetical protein
LLGGVVFGNPNLADILTGFAGLILWHVVEIVEHTFGAAMKATCSILKDKAGSPFGILVYEHTTYRAAIVFPWLGKSLGPGYAMC